MSTSEAARTPSLDPLSYANLYLDLLGDEWKMDVPGYKIYSDWVAFNVVTGMVRWLDLTPEAGIRQESSMRIPPGTSLGASVGILKGLADALKQG